MADRDRRSHIDRRSWIDIPTAEVSGLVVYEGTTTGAGNVGGTTLVDALLTEANDYWNDMTVVILSGAADGQSRDISDFALGGTITVSDAFAAQIVAGVEFAILPFKPSSAEVEDIKGTGFIKDQNSLVNLTPQRDFPLGNLFFVDPAGDDSTGTTWATAKNTIDDAIALCAGDNNDYIFVAPSSYDEDANVDGVEVDVAGIHLIGLGIRQTDVVNSNVGATSVIHVNASDVEVCGFYIIEGTATVEGIVDDGGNSYIHDNIFNGGMENGIHIKASNATVKNNTINGVTNDGIEIDAGANDNIIEKNTIIQAGVNGINCGAQRNTIKNNTINGVAGLTDVGLLVSGQQNDCPNNFIGGCAIDILSTGANNTFPGCHGPSLTGAGGATIEQDINVAGNSTKNFPLGNVYFVAKTGVDTNDGTSWAKAKLTIDAAIALCTADNNDYIFVGPGSYDEIGGGAGGVNVDVGSIHIIGSGIGFGGTVGTDVENSIGGATAVFTVTSEIVEIAGFEINEGVNTTEGIIAGDYTWIHDCYFNGTMENGVHATGGEGIIVEGCEFRDITNDGIELSGAAEYHTIRNNDFIGVGDNAIHLNGDDVDNNKVHHNRINGSAGTTDVGIRITLGDNNEILNNYIGECTTQKVDTGSNNSWTGNQQESGIAATNSIQDDLKAIYDTSVSSKPFPLGNVYFVATTGDDSDGLTWATALNSIDDAVALCTHDNNDYIFIAPGSYNENTLAVGVLMDIRRTHIIGLGYDVMVQNSNGGATSVFHITNDYCELTGIRIFEADLVDGILIDTADYTHVHDVICDGTMANGIALAQSNDCLIENCNFQNMTNDGIELRLEVSFGIFRNNYFYNCGSIGINVNGVGGGEAVGNSIHDNIINGGGGTTDVGISLSADSDENIISDNTVGECGTSNYADAGPNNIWRRNTPELESAGTLNDANVTDTITPIDTPRKAFITVNISAITVNLDDFEIEVLIGPAAAELNAAWYNITSDGVDRSIDRGNGIAEVAKEAQIDIGPLSVPAGSDVRLDYTKNSVNDRNFPYTVNFEEH